MGGGGRVYYVNGTEKRRKICFTLDLAFTKEGSEKNTEYVCVEV